MKFQSITALVLASGITAAHADIANGPNPYSAGFGFDTPDQAGATSWGGWSRGVAGTVYAEWDQFNGAANPATPDIGVSGTPSATFAWNAGTFAAGSGNLYNFGGLEVFTITVDGSFGPAGGPVTVALQTETWGSRLEFDNAGNPVAPVTLNGETWDTKTQTYSDPLFPSTFGDVELEQVLFTWTLDAPLAAYEFVLQTGPHSSFTQAAVDIGPSPVPLPAAVWMMLSGCIGLIGVRRSRAG